MKFFPRTSAEINIAEARIVQQSTMTAEQRVAAIKERFKKALMEVATSRQKIYDILVDLKEHHHEYGFKTAAAAVEECCQRSKRWANNFLSEVEGELELHGKVLKWEENLPTSADLKNKDKSETLKKVEKLPDPVAPPKPKDEPAPYLVDEPKVKNGHTPKVENGKPKSELGVWQKALDCAGALLRAVDDVHRACPNHAAHDHVICGIKDEIHMLEQWRSKV